MRLDKKELMEEIRGSKKFVPLYKEQEMIRKEAKKMGWSDGLKEGKKEGEPMEKISKYTGLSREEIETL